MTAPDLDPAVIAAAARALEDNTDSKILSERDPTWSDEELAQIVVAAVAPLIAAAALRESADWLTDNLIPGVDYMNVTEQDVQIWLRARADALAPVSKENQP